MTTIDTKPLDASVARVRATERALNRGDALRPYLDHAANVELFNADLRAARRPLKAAYAEHGLDYQLARHSIWMADTVRQLGSRHPRIFALGPSLLLLVREILRQLGENEAASAIDALASGGTRERVRRTFLPPKRGGIAGILAALRGGHVGAARKLLLECDAAERRELHVLANRLGELLAAGPAVHAVVVDVAAESIEEAVLRVGESRELAASYSE